MSISTNQQEATMSPTVPTQHPAVVLRSHYRHLKALLAIAIIAVVSLSVTVVMLARDDDGATTAAVSGVNSVPSVAKPDESKIAAAVSAGLLRQPETSRPDESKIASAVSAGQLSQPDTSRPDESRIAAALGTQRESGPDARARAYDEKVSSLTTEQLAAAFASGGHQKR
jgi:hypothetical protein